MRLGRKTTKALALVAQKVKVPQLSLVPKTIAQRDSLMGIAGEVMSVDNAVQLKQAGLVVSEMRAFVKQVKAAREQYSKPIRAVLDRLMELLREATSPVEDEIERIEGLAADFAKKEEKRVQAEEEERQREAQKLSEKQRTLETKAADATGKRADNLLQKAEQTEQQFQQLVTAPLPEAARAEGQTTRRVMRYEVVDSRTVYAGRPDLCKLPEVKGSEVLQRVVASEKSTKDEPDIATVPGLRLWWETAVTFKSK